MAEGLSDQGIAADVAYDGTEAAAKLGVNSCDVVVLGRRFQASWATRSAR